MDRIAGPIAGVKMLTTMCILVPSAVVCQVAFAYFLSLGSKVRDLRGPESQGAFAESVGLSRNALINIENDKSMPRADTLYRIAQKTGQPMTWFLSETEIAAPETPAQALKAVRDARKQLDRAMDCLLEAEKRLEALATHGTDTASKTNEGKQRGARRSAWEGHRSREGSSRDMELDE